MCGPHPLLNDGTIVRDLHAVVCPHLSTLEWDMACEIRLLCVSGAYHTHALLIFGLHHFLKDGVAMWMPKLFPVPCLCVCLGKTSAFLTAGQQSIP